MKRMIRMGLLTVLTAAIFSSCGNAAAVSTNPAVTEETMQATQTVWTENGSYGQTQSITDPIDTEPRESKLGYVTDGTEEYRGFLMDCRLNDRVERRSFFLGAFTNQSLELEYRW